MICIMPAVALPEDFVDELNVSESGYISGVSGPGVAAYLTRDQIQRADIYIGLILDGVRGYESVSSARPNITFQWVYKLTVSCWTDDVDYDFNPRKDPRIVIKVRVREL